MTDFEYIMAKCRKYHFTKWNENELRECKSILPSLTRKELLSLYRSKWVDENLRATVFKVLFEDKVGKRVERIHNLSTEELIMEFKDKKCGNIALIRKEMRERFKQNKGSDRILVTNTFNVSLKSDQQWVKSQIRKERYGNSNGNNYQWKKKS